MVRVEWAYSVPTGSLEKHVDAVDLDKDRPTIASCPTADRSIAAVHLLSRQGQDIVQVQDGMTAWRKPEEKRVPRKHRAGENPHP